MFLCKRKLVLVRQVQIVDTADQRLEALVLLQCARESFDEGGFPGALDAIEADEEGSGGVGGLVVGEAGEDEGDAVGGFVVDDGSHC